jgi:hypothetical protein
MYQPNITEDTPFELLSYEESVRLYVEQGFLESVYWGSVVLSIHDGVLFLGSYRNDLKREALKIMANKIGITDYELTDGYVIYHDKALSSDDNKCNIIKFKTVADEAFFRLCYEDVSYDGPCNFTITEIKF